MSGQTVDPQTAEQLARDRLVEALRDPAESTISDTTKLVDHTSSITEDLQRGAVPDREDIEQARLHLRQIEQRLDEVSTLFGWNPWDTGATWGELTASQQAEIDSRDQEGSKTACDGGVDE